MKSSRYLFISAALLFAVLHSLAVAQDEPPFRRGAALERMEQFKKIRMMEVLKLDEQTSIRFFSRYNNHQEVLREIRTKQVGALGQLQDLRRTKAGEKEYDRVIRDLRALEREMNDAKEKYLDELSEVLTKRQLAEYIVFEWKFQQNLRELLRGAQQGRGMSPR